MKNRIIQLETNLKEQKSEIDSLTGELNFVTKQLSERENLLGNLKKKILVTQKAIELLNFVQKATREKTKKDFETIVTHALKSVFQKDISLELEFGKRGNLPELNLNVRTEDKKECLDLLDSESGGFLNVVALALRIVLLELAVPRVEGFICLDERMSNVSKEYLEPMITFLKEINSKLKRQFLIISHNDLLCDSSFNNIRIEGKND